MGNLTKRLLSLLVVTVMVLSMIPLNALQVFATGSDEITIIGDETGSVISDDTQDDETSNIEVDAPEGMVAWRGGEDYYTTLQAAINACVVGDNTITLLADCADTVTIKQTEGVNITIDGAGKTYSGTIKVDGNNRPQGAETLTIKNVNFENTTAETYTYFINAEKNASDGNSQAHNLTVENCSFKSNNWHYAIGTRHPYNLVVKNCKANNVYYLIYNPQGGEKITVENCQVTGATYGIGAQKCKEVYVKDYTYTGKVAGFYGRSSSVASVVVLENVDITTTLEGQPHVTLWKNADGDTSKTYSITLRGENTYATATDSGVMSNDNIAKWFASQTTTNSPFVVTDEAKLVAQVGENKYETLKEAVAAANAIEGGATVTLLKDVTLGEKLTISGNVTIAGAYTITRADTYTGTLFTVNAGATLTLDGDLTIDGANEWTYVEVNGEKKFIYEAENYVEGTGYNSLDEFVTAEPNAPVATAEVIAVSGALVLNKVTLQNNWGKDGASMVELAANGQLTMNAGAVITHNVTNGQGPAVYMNKDSRFTMNGGEICWNAGRHHGGGAVSNRGGYMTMNGGKTANNFNVDGMGVALFIYDTRDHSQIQQPNFTMEGGEICYNVCLPGTTSNRNGTAIYARNGIMQMNGGSIHNNYGRNFAGVGVGSVALTITGGSIVNNQNVRGNTAETEHDLTGIETTKITGGTFTQDVSAWLAPDTGLVYDEATGTYTAREQTYVEWVKAELLAGNDVTLTEDIVITDYDLVNALKLPSNGNGKYNEAHGNGAIFHIIKPGVVLDLNGHSIVWDAHDDAYCNKRQVSLFMVTATGNAGETADFTVTDSVGTGKVDVYGMGSGMYVVLTTAKATIAGGTWTNYPCKTCGASNIFIYPSHGATLEITGGTFEQKDSEYLLGWMGSSKETTESSVGVDYDSTKVIISGGTFVNFDPEEVKFFDQAGGDQEIIDGCAEDYESKYNGDGTYGIVATTLIKVEVEMIPGVWGTSYITVENWSDLVGALGANTNVPVKVTLLEDIELDETLVISGEKTVVLDLNGKTISTVEKAEGTYMDAFTILANVTVTGNGTVDARPSNGYTFYIGDKNGTAGNLTIENGNFYGETSVVNNRLGTVTINGGYFEVVLENADDEYAYVLNCIDANYNNGTASIVVKGGTFANFNPESNAAEGTGTNFVAKGYQSVSLVDGQWTVVEAKYVAWNKDTGTLYEQVATGLLEAKAGETVQLLQNCEEKGFVSVHENTTLDLNGYTLTAMYVASFGDVIDSSDDNTGILAVDDKHIMLQQNNSQLPVRVGEGKYQFVTITRMPNAFRVKDGMPQYVFLPFFEPSAHELLLEGQEATGVTIVVRVSWKQGDGVRTQEFVYSDALVQTIINSYKPLAKNYELMFTLTLLNIEEATDMTFTSAVVSTTGVEILSQTITPTSAS